MSDAPEKYVPEGWTYSQLRDVGRWTTGGTPSRKSPHFFGGPIAWIKSGDLNDGVVEQTEESLTEDGLNSSSAKVLPPNTVSVALYGATIGKLGILGIDAATNQACANCEVTPSACLYTYLFYYLLEQREQLIGAGKGGAQPNLTNTLIREWPILLAPLREQERIVAKVDAMLAQVQSVRKRFAVVSNSLRRFRQTILAQACSGTLTEDWRTTTCVEQSARDLFEAIEQSYIDAESGHGGKAGQKTEDAHDLNANDLPETWVLVELKWLCRPGRAICYGILKPGADLPGGVPYVRVTDYRNDVIKLDTIRKTSEEIAGNYKRSVLSEGDILLSIRGTVGRVARVPPSLDGGNITQDTARISPHPLICGEYLEWYLRSPSAQRRMQRCLKGVAVRGINIGDVRPLQVAFPPLGEQREIVRRVEALFALADSIDQRVQLATKWVEALTQSILAKTFRGELVPTEAELARVEGRDYESADQLLLRIREQPTQHAPEKKSRYKRAIQDASGMKDKVIIIVKRNLLGVLKKAKSGLSPEELFRQAGCAEVDIDGFYEKLREGIEAGQIVQMPEKPDPDNPAVVLSASKV